jgi:hypothetical protein
MRTRRDMSETTAAPSVEARLPRKEDAQCPTT